jgi:3-hydroxyisobutyrate dehydrogenase-like beta-hydroxyacid dehydrogenase
MIISFIGLGTMGAPMAGHLVKAGFNVIAFNRTASKCHAWQKTYPNGSCCTDITQAVEDVDVIISCIGNDDDLRHCAYGPSGIIENAKKGAVWVDHTTASAIVAQELYEACHDNGLHFVDAPVSGGQRGAESGQLTIMMGGDEDVVAKITPLLDVYAKQITHVGACGSGQLTKMVNQICLAGLIQALAEGLNFAKNAGLDAKKVVDAIGHGAAQSWQMDNRAKTMIDDTFDFGFAVDWMRKDLAICLEQARKLDVTLPVTALIDQFYADIQTQGGGRLDTSSLIKRLS